MRELPVNTGAHWNIAAFQKVQQKCFLCSQTGGAAE